MGNKPTNINVMLGLDMYLASLDRGECHGIKDQIKSLPITFHSLMSWDMAGTAYWNLFVKGRKIYNFRKQTYAVRTRIQFVRRFTNLAGSSYQALMLINAKQVICWINPGFTTRTGYPANFTISQTPVFLQENTSIEERELLQSQLKVGQTFTGSIMNYLLNKENTFVN